MNTRLNIQADAKVLALRVRVPLIGGTTVELSTDDGKVEATLPYALFPFLHDGEVVYVTLSILRCAVEPEPPASPLLLPQVQ